MKRLQVPDDPLGKVARYEEAQKAHGIALTGVAKYQGPFRRKRRRNPITVALGKASAAAAVDPDCQPRPPLPTEPM